MATAVARCIKLVFVVFKLSHVVLRLGHNRPVRLGFSEVLPLLVNSLKHQIEHLGRNFSLYRDRRQVKRVAVVLGSLRPLN